MNKKKIIISIIAVLLLIVAAFTTGYLISKGNQKEEMKEQTKKEETKENNKTPEQNEENKETTEEGLVTEDEVTEDEKEENELLPNKIVITYTEEKHNTKNKKGIIITENIRNIPSITFSSNQKAADKIEKSLIEFSDNEWNNNILIVAKETAEEEPFAESTEPESLGASLLFSNTPSHNQRITFNLGLEGGFGGVGWVNSYGYNYDLTTGELLTLKTITDDYQTLIKDLTAEVERQLNIFKKEFEIYEVSETELIGFITKTGNWYFAEDKLIIIFQKYDIADGATGPIVIEIDKEFINPHLKDEYKF